MNIEHRTSNIERPTSNEKSENLGDEVLERNKNLNRGFRKLVVWREAVKGLLPKID